MSIEFPPRRDADLLTFALQYSAQITADPTSLGLSEAMAATLAGLVSDYQTKLEASTNGATRGPSTVFAKDEARRALVAYIRLTARQIQGTSTVTDQQRTDLKLPVRGTPAPMPPPGIPESFSVTLNGNGSLGLKWKCSNPRGSQGTMYQVWRSVDAGALTYVGGCGSKRFTDDTVPAGASTITYHLQAVRSTAVGPWATFNVTFGTGGGTTVIEEQPSQMAA